MELRFSPQLGFCGSQLRPRWGRRLGPEGSPALLPEPFHSPGQAFALELALPSSAGCSHSVLGPGPSVGARCALEPVPLPSPPSGVLLSSPLCHDPAGAPGATHTPVLSPQSPAVHASRAPSCPVTTFTVPLLGWLGLPALRDRLSDKQREKSLTGKSFPARWAPGECWSCSCPCLLGAAASPVGDFKNKLLKLTLVDAGGVCLFFLN